MNAGKTLYFCRHAKSSWSDPAMADFDRPLNERGLRDAPLMARSFADRNEPVDLLVSSPARRAIDTATSFAEALGMPGAEIVKDPRIYEANVRTLMEVINELPPTHHRVMLFGHNPGFSSIVEHLAGGGAGEMPTCAIARIDLGIDDWKAVTNGLGTLVWLDHPERHHS